MMKHNFFAGPSILPQETIDATINALKNFAETEVSLASISHRTKEFEAVMNEAVALFKELLNIPEGYSVLFLQGGASFQFTMVPYNLMKSKAIYVNSGRWSDKAIDEAKLFGDVVEIKGDDWFSIPKDFDVPQDADYIHITSNNTVMGTQYHEDKDYGIPLVADMSSDIFSRPVDISKYALIYGGAQKNLAPSGVTFVIVKDDILGKVERQIPTMLDYRTHIKKNSMFNTPPVISVFTAMHTLRWIKANGGVKGMQKRNKEKSDLLYNEVDRNKMFKGTVAREDRSVMNPCFVMTDNYKNLEPKFTEYCQSLGMLGFKGHRSVGGYRTSMYNALPIESVQAMVDAMKTFEKENA
ncbi:MAG: 3-phosphoserine/phosphohydroxythreonine transaminase [Bacteroidota bacterium]|nr:3-phosphoserine/phosphohydroxythreonine transaminase [Bacteroidota bacterium]